jgi:hypothetical protein
MPATKGSPVSRDRAETRRADGGRQTRATPSRVDPRTGHRHSDLDKRGGTVDGAPAAWCERLAQPSVSLSLQRLAGNRAVNSLAAQRDSTATGRDGDRRVQRDGTFVGPLTEEQESDRLRAARQLASHMQAAWIDAATQGNGWISAASDFGLCYKNAFDRHEEVRKKQEQADKLAADVAFGALMLVAGGALGSLATIAKNQDFFTTMPEWKADGILEIMKSGAGSAVEGIGRPEVGSHQVAMDPLTFYLDLRNAVDHQVAATTKHLNKYVQRYDQYVAGERPLHDLYDVDPTAIRNEINEWKSTQTLFKEPPKIDKEGLTRELEIGLWARWVPGLHTVSRRTSPCSGLTYTRHSYSGPGRHVERRIRALSIADLPSDIDWGTLWMSDSDVQKLIAWGRGWTPGTTFDLG